MQCHHRRLSACKGEALVFSIAVSCVCMYVSYMVFQELIPACHPSNFSVVGTPLDTCWWSTMICTCSTCLLDHTYVTYVSAMVTNVCSTRFRSPCTLCMCIQIQYTLPSTLCKLRFHIYARSFGDCTIQ